MKICFATNNVHKLEEVIDAVAAEKIQIVSLAEIGCYEELPETRDTLEGNSLQKAEYVLAKYDVPCFADDTGLEVSALNGEPGVYSARYAGLQRNSNDNIQLVLDKLGDTDNRRAQFRTVISLVGIESQPRLFEGVVNGFITKARRGTSGFGYDPVFIPDGFDQTFAEMTLTEKNRLSHRGKAVEKLIAYLKTLS